MSELRCVICGISEKESKHMIGITYNPEDHKDKDDVALCDDCIMEAHNMLKNVKLKDRIREEIANLQKENGKENA